MVLTHLQHTKNRFCNYKNLLFQLVIHIRQHFYFLDSGSLLLIKLSVLLKKIHNYQRMNVCNRLTHKIRIRRFYKIPITELEKKNDIAVTKAFIKKKNKKKITATQDTEGNDTTLKAITFNQSGVISSMRFIYSTSLCLLPWLYFLTD